jgi:hypothetical protein
VLLVRYTAKDGGDKLATAAAGAVADFVADVENLSQDQGLFAMFDLRGEFASEWARAAPAPSAPGSGGSTGPTVRTVAMKGLVDRLPAYTKGRAANKVLATDVFLLLSPSPNWVSQATMLTPDGSNPPFTGGDVVGQTVLWKANGAITPIADWTVQLSGSGSVALTKGYVIVRYELK